MVSRKRSAQQKRIAEFKAQLGGMDDAFERETKQKSKRAQEKEAALRRKACESKNRYSSRSEAEAVIQDCADHGRIGLHCYRCDYCGGWHLTSKPERDW